MTGTTIEMLDSSATNINTSTTSFSSNQINRINSPPSVNLTSLTSSQDSMIPTSPTNNSNSMNRRDSTHKSTTGKSLPSSLKTPRTSSVTAFHSKNFRIHTCCGILELNCLKMTSLAALVVSLFAFTALIAIISLNYSVVATYHSSLETLETSGTYYRELMKLSARAAVTADYNRTLSLEYVDLYNSYFKEYYVVMNNLIANVPPSVLYWNQHNMLRENVKSRKAVNMEVAMMSQVTNGNYTAALRSLDSDQYKDLLTGYEEEVQSIIDYVADLKYSNAEMDLATTTVALIIICISLAIVIPVLIVFVLLSVQKDNSKEKQLRQVKKYMIMDTINDPSVVEKFKDFCKQERSEENFALLEKINEYKKLCERSFDIQVFLFDTDVLSSSDQFSETTTSSTEDASKKKNKAKKGYTEKDLMEIEKKKFEIAFEIYSEFLDVRGDRSVNISKAFADNVKQHLDYFAKGENESIPESLFDSVEYEMCVLMMDTHHRFKQFMEVSLKEKKQILSTLKRKTVKK
ncbi:predicted protein [Naegleria gruberi]|uniref:Predicted protein n=1 Tax=Naegleria gruberi TaxID=5762 RepID=D2VKG7_NAEGR|nr:uncharacterized protein NAEGRDRAFT_69387 [Naegleria gruberi]EFC42593.1 predicted protein [Naegleria gruberi]|eukprot:XP_002675337.1 predicted protein [Naegleria gruberi strain NEG-M]